MKATFGILSLLALLMWAIRLFMRRPRYRPAPPKPVKPPAKIQITLIGGPFDGKQVWTTTDHIFIRLVMDVTPKFDGVKPPIDRDFKIVTYERDPENANIFNYKGGVK